MDCRDVHDQLMAYVDGLLDDAEAEAVEGHVASCEACRAELEATERVVSAMDTALTLQAHTYDTKGALARFKALRAADSSSTDHVESSPPERTSPAVPWWRRILSPVPLGSALAAAAAAALVAIAPWAGEQQAPPEPSPQLTMEVVAHAELLEHMDLLHHLTELESVEEVDDIEVILALGELQEEVTQ